MLTRRGLLGLLAAAAADPERLLWTPGQRLISIPQPPGPADVSAGYRVMVEQNYDYLRGVFVLKTYLERINGPMRGSEIRIKRPELS